MEEGRKDGPFLPTRYHIQAFLGPDSTIATYERGFNPFPSPIQAWTDSMKLFKVTEGVWGLLGIWFSDKELTWLVQGPKIDHPTTMNE